MNSLEIIVNAVASLNAFILFSLLVFKKNNSLPNYALGGMTIILGLYFCNSIIMLSGRGPSFYTLFFIVQFLAIFYTPFLSVYIYSLLGKKTTTLWPVFLISAINGLIPCYLLLQYLQLSNLHQIAFFDQLTQGPYPVTVTIYSVIFYSFQQIVFIILYLKIKNIKRNFSNVISNLDSIKLIYLDRLMLLLVVGNFFIIILYLVFDILFVEYLLLPGIATAIYSLVVYNAFKNNVIFTNTNYELHLKKVQNNNPEIIQTETPDNNTDDLLIEEIKTLLRNSTFLQDSDLSITKFSTQLDRPVNTVSKCINSSFKQNFHDLINSNRIENSKTLLSDNPNITIEGLAYEVGFNSRATFYRAFKKHTQTTPTEYLNSLK